MINQETFKTLLQKVKEDSAAGIYTHTDHLITQIEVGGLTILYVSLDNSVRANLNNNPLSGRLLAICETVTKCLEQVNKNCIVFFSESCRGSVGASWFKMRQTIADKCSIQYLGECANNEDTNGMAFGVSAFCTNTCIDLIDAVLPRHILTVGFGSGAIGVKLVTGEIVWGIHFPIDFARTGADNLQYQAMAGLVSVMKSHEGSVAAMGDFNTIPGNPFESIKAAIPEDMELISADHPTFYGAFYDTMVPREGDNWIEYPV